MKKLRCDKPYDVDEARKKKGLPRRRRKDSRATQYELTIRIPEEYRAYFDGKRKLVRNVFALNKRDDLKTQTEAFEDEKNAELERKLEERGWVKQEESGREPGLCTTPLGDYIERYIAIRSNGSVSAGTIRNETSHAKYVSATIGSIPISEVTSEDIEECLLKVPELSEKWALERQRAWEENRKTAEWAKKHGTLAKPYKPIKVAGPDKQAKILKFLREVMNYALEKDDIAKNVAKAKFLTRVFKKSRPLIDPLMADEAARFLHETEALSLGFMKLSLLLLLLNTGMRPEEMLAVRAGNIIFGENETLIKITSVVSRDGKKIVDYPKSDASRRSIPVDEYTAQIAKLWIELKSQEMRELGFKPTMSMPLCSPGMKAWSYQNWLRNWQRFVAKAGFEGMRPYALRHTFATLNLANGENIKTVSVLMGHASSAYTLDLYAGYVPNTGLGIGTRYMNFLRRTA
ncbi:site-specific integrase [Gordonibacter sp. 28C]|uniref:site-specific integrase n=1 Tax=Gordonibacter sp. 28C TaxID=2078569 RepID=UPI000DF85ACE|nr:site-specific integrase [Gordonibacter sp. 28C]RDB64323.1 site-specific integrase [Gordonibacter sp. 28C]